jgi:tryptophanyl-tRNA synthetase
LLCGDGDHPVHDLGVQHLGDEACADALAPVQAEFDRLMKDKAYLETVMKNGADQAGYMAARTMSKVRRKIGFVELGK